MIRLGVKSATCILILGMLALPLYSAEEEESLNNEIYASERKATEIFIEAEIIRTPAENLGVEKEKIAPFGPKEEKKDERLFPSTFLIFKDFENINELFKDPSKAKKIGAPRFSTLSGIEAKFETLQPIYYIEDATVDEDGDITCKIKKTKVGLSFKVLPKILEKDTNLISVDYELGVDTLIKRVASTIPAIASIKEFETLWMPIINTREMKGGVRLKNGQGFIIGLVSESISPDTSELDKTQGMSPLKITEGEMKAEPTLELISITVRKGTM